MLSIKEMLNLPKEEQEALIKETNDIFFQNFGVHPDAVSVKDFIKEALEIPPEPPAIVQELPDKRQTQVSMRREPPQHRPHGIHNPGNQQPKLEQPKPHVFNPDKECPADPNDPRNKEVKGYEPPKQDKGQPQAQRCMHGGQTYFVDSKGNVKNIKGQSITGSIADEIKKQCK